MLSSTCLGVAELRPPTRRAPSSTLAASVAVASARSCTTAKGRSDNRRGPELPAPNNGDGKWCRLPAAHLRKPEREELVAQKRATVRHRIVRAATQIRSASDDIDRL